MDADWLPSSPAFMRIQLAFKHSSIPFMPFKMRDFLATFQICPIRVFRDPVSYQLITACLQTAWGKLSSEEL